MIWTPKLVISLVIVIGCLGLMFLGIDSEVKSVFLLSSGWAFGTEFKAIRQKRAE